MNKNNQEKTIKTSHTIKNISMITNLLYFIQLTKILFIKTIQ